MHSFILAYHELRHSTKLLVVAAMLGSSVTAAAEKPSRITLVRDDAQGRLQVRIDDKEAIAYQYGKQWDLAHFYPVHSPSGRPLTSQIIPSDHPHMRSFWVADKVQLEGHGAVSFYNAYYSKVDPKNPESPFRQHIRHRDFLAAQTEGNQARLGMKLVWEIDMNVPVLDEERRLRIVALEQGEYFVDFEFTLTASYGNVTFDNDWKHYAWPYVRMHPLFSETKGGTITNSEGATREANTIGKPAHWVDYSNTVDDVTEGLAMFSHTDNPYPHQWFTRAYGLFGPRRTDDRSGKPFVLARGETLRQRVGVLIHRGSVHDGHVAERYDQFVHGKL